MRYASQMRRCSKLELVVNVWMSIHPDVFHTFFMPRCFCGVFAMLCGVPVAYSRRICDAFVPHPSRRSAGMVAVDGCGLTSRPAVGTLSQGDAIKETTMNEPNVRNAQTSPEPMVKAVF